MYQGVKETVAVTNCQLVLLLAVLGTLRIMGPQIVRPVEVKFTIIF